MPARRRLDADQRGMALARLQSGVAQRAVRRRLRVSQSVISRLQERFQTTGTTRERSHPGCLRVTTRREDRYIGLAALRERSVTAETIRGQLRVATHPTSAGRRFGGGCVNRACVRGGQLSKSASPQPTGGSALPGVRRT